ncbi:type VII toxin-antitoxin system HepT family RNase toxin [Microbulbifer elongatus]|uniref:type VII toxin-antitoxin system HepT family RNase toxin n=1 Tax=Microbulbifer elongatus TaxID=86173 RepID=UPI001E5D4661|nr:DUF86 domain-containing protein [Microbulbifer elongatus]
MNYQAYCTALIEQTKVHERLLDTIRSTPETGLLERTAAERSLQILIEAAIGATKHANKKLNYPARSEAASAIAQLLEHHPLTNVSAQEMKGAVGMRNAIVHDYLNLDWELIRAVLEEQKYKKVGLFVEHCCELLCGSTD